MSEKLVLPPPPFSASETPDAMTELQDVEATYASQSIEDMALERAAAEQLAVEAEEQATSIRTLTSKHVEDPDMQLPPAPVKMPKMKKPAAARPSLAARAWGWLRRCARFIVQAVAVFVCSRLLFTKWTVPRRDEKRRDWPRMRVWWNRHVYHSLPADMWNFYWRSLYKISTDGFDGWWTEGLAILDTAPRSRFDDCGDNAAEKSRARPEHAFMTTPPTRFVAQHPIASRFAVVVYLLALLLLALSVRYTIRGGGFALALLTRGGEDAPMQALIRGLGLRRNDQIYTIHSTQPGVVRRRDRDFAMLFQARGDSFPELVAWNAKAWDGVACVPVDTAKLYASDSRESAALTLFYNASIAYWVFAGYTAFSARHFGLPQCMALVMRPPENSSGYEPLLLVNPSIEAPANATRKTLEEASTFWPGRLRFTRATAVTYSGACVDGDVGADRWGATLRPACTGTLKASVAWQMHGLAAVLRGAPREQLEPE